MNFYMLDSIHLYYKKITMMKCMVLFLYNPYKISKKRLLLLSIPLVVDHPSEKSLAGSGKISISVSNPTFLVGWLCRGLLSADVWFHARALPSWTSSFIYPSKTPPYRAGVSLSPAVVQCGSEPCPLFYIRGWRWMHHQILNRVDFFFLSFFFILHPQHWKDEEEKGLLSFARMLSTFYSAHRERIIRHLNSFWNCN